ncbi:hypothetical protein BTO01_04775 [Vibrio jasicida]|uniref:hypothetical protein n=1 Tax=Vibrio jasicida TaxID=766224 RepID=UPI000CF48AB7|nr:hypothetical protein [Vibrio jasicida]PQJ70627.1 hypothetical protein BTO01_04775 [Vibrio jasicida]
MCITIDIAKILKNSSILNKVFSNYAISAFAFALVVLRDVTVINENENSIDFYMGFMGACIVSGVIYNLVYFRIKDNLEINPFSSIAIILSFCIIYSLAKFCDIQPSGLYIVSSVVMTIQSIPNGYLFHKEQYVLSKLERITSPLLFCSIISISNISLDKALFISSLASFFISTVVAIKSGMSIKFKSECKLDVSFISPNLILESIVSVIPNIYWSWFLDSNQNSVVLVRVLQTLYSFIIIGITPIMRTSSEIKKIFPLLISVSIASIITSLISKNDHVIGISCLIIFIISFFIEKTSVINGYKNENKKLSILVLSMSLPILISDWSFRDEYSVFFVLLISILTCYTTKGKVSEKL